MKNFKEINRTSMDIGVKKNTFLKSLLVLIGVLITSLTTQVWADYDAIVGCAATNSDNYTVKLNVARCGNCNNNGPGEWQTIEMSKAGVTFEGKKLYVAQYRDWHDGLGTMQFQMYDGDYQVWSKQNFGSWKSASDPFWMNRIIDYDTGDGGNWYSWKTMSNGAKVYFDASGWAQTTIKLVTAHANCEKYYTLSLITGTKLYYGTNTDTWSDAMGWGVVGGTDRSGNNSQWITDISAHAKEFTGLKNWDLNSTGENNAYLCVNNGKAGEQPNMYYFADYTGQDNTSTLQFNNTQTYNTVVKVGAGSYTSANSKATISISSYELTSQGGTTNRTPELSTSENSETVSACRTATTRLQVGTVDGDYQFDGWYTAATGGSLVSNSTDYTYYPTSANTYYARFSQKAYTLTYYANGGTGSAPAAETIYSGNTITVKDNINRMTKSGKVFAGWAKGTEHRDAGTVDYIPGVSDTFTADGNVDLYAIWKDGSYFISITDPTTNGEKNTTDFVSTQNLTNTARTVNGVTFSKSYYNTSGSISSSNKIKGYNETSKYIIYDAKTTVSKVRVYMKHNSGSTTTANIYYYVAKEGVYPGDNQTFALTKGSEKVLEVDLSSTKGSRFVIGTDQYQRADFTQIIAIEEGTAFPSVGETGYQVSFPGRTATIKAVDYSFNGLTINSADALKIDGGSELRLISGGSRYVSFETTAATQLQVTTGATTQGFTVCTNKSSAAATGYSSGGTASTTYSINLMSAGTYYIVGNTGSNEKITKIAFADYVACTAPTGLAAGTITKNGATFTITDPANKNNYEIVCKTTSGAPAADATPTATGITKSITVNTLSAGTTYYAWVRSVESRFNKSSWVALTGGTFTTTAACSATAEAGANKSTTVDVGVAMAATAASSGYTGAWSIKASSPSTDTGQLGTTSSNTMTFTPNQSGTYTLVWTVTDNSDGSCSATDEATVTVSRNTPTLYSVSGTATICSGGNTDITLEDSEEGASYQLKKGGVAEGVAKTGTGGALTWNVSAAGTYTVSAVQTTKYSARDMSASAVVSIYDAVSIGTQPTAAVNATVGQAASLSGLALVSGTFNSAAYQWQTCNSDGSSASDITSGSAYANYTTATLSFTPGSAGTYYFKCKVTDGCSNTVSSNVVTVTAKNQPAQYTVSGTASICSGSNTNITLSDSETGVSYQLYKGGDAVGDPKDGTDDAIVWTVSEEGTYTVKAVGDANYWERAMSSSATISFKTATSISTQPATAVDATVNEDFTLGSALVAAGDGTLQYQWFSYSNAAGTDGETSVRDASTTKTFTTSQASAGTYYYRVKVIGGCGTVASDVIAVTVAACSPITASVTFDNNKSAKYNTSWADSDVTTSGGASWAKSGVGTDTGHKMTPMAMKLDGDDDYIKITLPVGVTSGSITVKACTWDGASGTLIINSSNSTSTPLSSTEVGLEGKDATYKINGADAGTWTAPTLKTVTYDEISAGGDYYIKRGSSKSIYVFSVIATGTKPCAATTYTVTYANGGATGDVPVDASSPYEEDAPVTVLAKGSLAKTGYSFGGWSANVDLTIDEAVVTAGTPIAAGKKFAMPATNVTLTAVWNINSYDLTWALAGGTTTSAGTGIASGVSVNTTASVEYETTLSAPSVEKTGYTFSAWSPSVAATMPAANTTYTATWTKDTYTITYDLHDGDAGSVSGKTSYQITDDDYDLPTPEWDGHTFLGWYATYSDGDYSDPVSVLASGSTGNKTYHAKWADGVEIVWTITKVDSKLYKGGTGYSVKAVVNNTSWTGHDNLVLSASDGVTLGTPTKSTVDSKAQIVADFSISGSLADDAITFSLYAPATGVYAAIEDEKEVELDDCPGGGSSAIVWDFTDRAAVTLTNNVSYSYIAEDGETEMRYTAGSSCAIIAPTKGNHYLQENGKTSSASATDVDGKTAIGKNRLIRLFVSGTGTLSSTCYPGNEGAFNIYEMNSTHTASSGTALVTGYTGGTTSTSITTTNGLWIEATTKGYFYTITWTPDGDGSDGIETSLAWSDDDAIAGTVNKNDNDVDFRIYASPTPANAGGTITYSSSNTSVATVSSDGTVHIINNGNTTITASMSAYGCYSPAEPITYSLVVANTCDDTPGTIVNNDGSAIAGNAVNRGACETLTLKLTGHSGSTIQWKKDGVAIPSANAATYSVPAGESGVYSATITGSSCTLTSTNSITVTTAGVPNPTIFADDFYVKSGKWFGYRLMQINRGETVTVKTAPTGWTEDTDFSITTDASGIVSISGRKTISTPADKTLTLTIDNGCGGSVDKNITIREMAATAKPTIAWIATNNKGGSGQKDNVKADESTNTDLYDHLDDDYIITPRNCYWTTNEADLVKEYSQYDLIILTDYPNSGTCPSGKSGKSNSYTNAIGLLIDHKPIMTFEAFVAGCPNWGIASDPKNTQETQTDMTLLCNADEIFGTSGKFAAGEAITVTSASSGQALQGFPVASSPDFVFIGKITDNYLKTYVACCERQHEIAARMMVFGLNSSIMSSLTDDGKTMVKGFIEYLLKDDPASVPDCSVIFNGSGVDDSWYTTSNWEAGSLPDQYASVRIDAPCVVPANEDPAKAGRIKIHVTDMNSGSLTIEPEGRMIVEKTITRIEGNAYTIHMPTEPEDLIIQSDETAQGALIFDNESGTTQATVEMYSKGRYYDGVYNWQYVAVPLVSASRWNMGDWAYCFDNSIGDWTGNDVCPAFSAVGVTRMDDELPTYEFNGPLASTKNQTLTLYTSAAGNDGYNMIGNSWTAPIQIVNFQPGDFGTALYQVNIYNTGHDPEDGPAVEESTDQQGRWKTIPIAATQAAIDAGTWEDLKVIPSMQAFEVQNETGANTTLTLNYDRLVRTLPTEPNLNETKRAPRRTPVERTAVPQMRITLKDETTRENLYLFSGEQFSEGFDNGWDGVYNAGEAGYMQIYMLSPIGNLEISAQPEMEGTTFGFTAGSREVYTFSFKYVGNEELYFNDLKEKKSTLINDENEYTFTAQEGENGIRFMISATPYNSQQISTGMTNMDAEAPQAQKVIYNDKLFIIRGGKVFSADGHLVK